MRRRPYCHRPTVVCVLFGAALVCLCFLSTKLMLIILALTLICAGIYLLRC